jgi:hypothetical protein
MDANREAAFREMREIIESLQDVVVTSENLPYIRLAELVEAWLDALDGEYITEGRGI